MKLNDVNFGTQRPDMLRRKAVEQSESARARATADESSAPKGAVEADRVEISDVARATSRDQEQLKREVEFARRAMYSIPPLSKERAEELLRRLEQGYYNAPDVRMKLSENLAGEIASHSPEMGGEAESA